MRTIIWIYHATSAALLCALCTTPVYAEDEPMLGPPDIIDDTRASVASKIDSFAAWLDHLVGSKDEYIEGPGSYLKIHLSLLAPRNQAVIYDSKMLLKLALPNIDRRFRLVLESDPDIEQRRRSSHFSHVDVMAIDRLPEYQGYDASIKTGWQTNAELGIVIKSPVDYFIRATIARNMMIQKWLHHISLSAARYTSGNQADVLGYRTDTRLWRNYYYSLSLILGRNTPPSDQDWLSETALTHNLNTGAAMYYEIGASGTYAAPRLDAYWTRIRFRQRLSREWIHFEMRPQVRWERANAFNPVLALFIGFELLVRSD